MKKIVTTLILCASLTANAGVQFSSASSVTHQPLSSSSASIGESKGVADLTTLVNALAPQGWIVNIGPGLEAVKVNWVNGYGWRNSLKQIVSSTSNLHVAINEKMQVIAVAKNQSELDALSTPNPKVWIADPALSLSENILQWGQQANITIVWKTQTDFPVEARSIITGELGGRGGVIDRILVETLTTSSPLKMRSQPSINALVITDGGFKRNK